MKHEIAVGIEEKRQAGPPEQGRRFAAAFLDRSGDLGRVIFSGLARVEKELANLLASSDPDVGRGVAAVTIRPGKRLRPLVALLAKSAVGRELDIVDFQGAAVLEALHLASLVHDDVIDESCLRNNMPTANLRYGNTVAVLLGDFLFARALKTAASFAPSVLYRIHQTLEALISGELNQAAGAGGLPTIGQYLAWIEAKTARLFWLAATIGRSGDDRSDEYWSALARYGLAFGLAYQIKDDLLDLVGTEAELGRTSMADCGRGLFTYPIILQCALQPEFFDRLRQRRLDDLSWRTEIVGALMASGAVPLTVELCRGWAGAAAANLRILPPGAARSALARLADWVGEFPAFL